MSHSKDYYEPISFSWNAIPRFQTLLLNWHYPGLVVTVSSSSESHEPPWRGRILTIGRRGATWILKWLEGGLPYKPIVILLLY